MNAANRRLVCQATRAVVADARPAVAASSELRSFDFRRGLALASELRLSGTPTFLIGTVSPDRNVAVSDVLAASQPIEELPAF
jgi:hypothetical protein